MQAKDRLKFTYDSKPHHLALSLIPDLCGTDVPALVRLGDVAQVEDGGGGQRDIITCPRVMDYPVWVLVSWELL